MENEKKLIVQKVQRKETSPLELAIRYYTILSAIGNVHLTKREIQLIAFTAIKGNISYASNREEFNTLYSSSSPTINNMISKLKGLNILVKEAGKIKVTPQLLLNFNNNIVLQLSLSNG